MTTITNYTTLQSAIQQELEDDSSEFTLYMPIAIDIAEQRLTKDIDTYGLVAVTTVTTSASTNLVAKPTGYRLPFQFTQQASDGSVVSLIKVTDEFINEYWPVPASTSSTLKYYADYDNDYFILAPTPTSAYSLVLKYQARPTALSTTNLTNYFTESCSDSLFFASLVEMCRWMRNYELMKVYDENYNRTIMSQNNEGRRSRRDDDRVPMNPLGSQNNLKEGTH